MGVRVPSFVVAEGKRREKGRGRREGSPCLSLRRSDRRRSGNLELEVEWSPFGLVSSSADYVKYPFTVESGYVHTTRCEGRC